MNTDHVWEKAHVNGEIREKNPNERGYRIAKTLKKTKLSEEMNIRVHPCHPWLKTTRQPSVALNLVNSARWTHKMRWNMKTTLIDQYNKAGSEGDLIHRMGIGLYGAYSWVMVLLYVVIISHVNAVEIGDTRSQVLDKMGKPRMILKKGNAEHLFWENGIFTELEDGRVVRFNSMVKDVHQNSGENPNLTQEQINARSTKSLDAEIQEISEYTTMKILDKVTTLLSEQAPSAPQKFWQDFRDAHKETVVTLYARDIHPIILENEHDTYSVVEEFTYTFTKRHIKRLINLAVDDLVSEGYLSPNRAKVILEHMNR
ncbi:MAG: hypothetical protein JJU29_04280 [Verrucomicrobia bacterium]|nr:hypothetical protein [Verrucomicrobiota bacterium]MCH8512052.1 hypothetical protein [Kiritimatiellia bacterium]